MRAAAVAATGGAGLVSAVAAAGRPALAGLGVLILLLVGMLCWVIASRPRTQNVVALIRATRRRG